MTNWSCVDRWTSLIPFKEYDVNEIEFYKSIGIIVKIPNVVLTKEQGNDILLKVMEEIRNERHNICNSRMGL